jgi:hypothetical protein
LPVAVLSPTFLFTAFEKAKAETIGEALWFNGLSKIEEYKEFFAVWKKIGQFIMSIIEWVANFFENIAIFSIQLFAWIYEFLATLVLYTPLFIFNNGVADNLTLTFSLVSVSLVILFSIIESMKQMFQVKCTPFNDILKRFPIAIGIAGASPFLFEKGFTILNKLSHSITEIGRSQIADIGESAIKISTLEAFALIGFDLTLIGLLVPIVLSCGRRWFDLLSLACLSPLALSSWVFDHTRYLHSMWWSNVKGLSLMQLAYATFICFIGLFIFGTKNIVDGKMLLVKALVIIGGLYRLANPPNFVVRFADHGDDMKSMFGEVVKNYINPIRSAKGGVTKAFGAGKDHLNYRRKVKSMGTDYAKVFKNHRK